MWPAVLPYTDILDRIVSLQRNRCQLYHVLALRAMQQEGRKEFVVLQRMHQWHQLRREPTRCHSVMRMHCRAAA
jgi:hypothetical protein